MSFGVWIAGGAAAADIELPVGSQHEPIRIRATGATHWPQGSYEVWVLRGDCRIEQGNVSARASDAVLWIDRAEAFSGQPSKVIAYFEGGVAVEFGRSGDPHSISRKKAQSLQDETWLGRFHTTAGIELAAPVSGHSVAETGADLANYPAIFQRGLDARRPAPPGVMPVQYAREEIAPPTGQPFAPGLPGASPLTNRIQIFSRGGGRWDFRTEVDPDRNERIVTFPAPIKMVISGIDEVGTVSLETDRIVAWVPNVEAGGPNPAELLGNGQGPLELYLEGNIVFRQGDRVIYADRMYYNVLQEYGVVLKAEMLTPVPEYQGLLRIKADVLQQVNRQHFEATGAALTSSRIGVPRYWLQTDRLAIDDVQTPLVDPLTGLPLVDAQGSPVVQHQYLATSQNNFIYLAGLPVFYWPLIASDLEEPTYYVDRIKVESDGIFGNQIYLDLDLYQLLGIENPPEGSEWSLSTDYLSDRGPALGTNYKYRGNTLFGVPGEYRGYLDAWGIHDSGLDNLGLDRRSLDFPDPLRGRVLGQHRQYLPGEWQLSAELGLISDRNFLEQYYELEWDTFKDESTGFELKRFDESSSYGLAGDVRLNEFFTQTEGLRADHFLLGQSLFFDRLTWHEHTHVGYARLREAEPPVNAEELAVYSPLPWENDVEGLRAATRHELDLPLELGPTKVVPYVLGEAAYWGQDVNGEEVTRLYYQTGIKASLPLWRADPQVKSELFNLNGLAHKVVYEAEVFHAEADEDLGRFALYDQLDDDSTEAFRRRMAVNTFDQPVGTFVPRRFDERYFALRSNLQGDIASPSTEIAGDMTQARLGLRQRWQTKRGLPGRERIVDWIVLDLDASLFPDPDRDNFGEVLGLIDYDFQWHLGDRFTLLSDGFYDVFSDGLQQTTFGALISRPEYGNVYAGIRSTEGPISSTLLTGSLSYRLSEKWIANAGASWDLGEAGNIGQSAALVRIGESFLVKFGFNFDASRDNLGVSLLVEPRFLPNSRLGRVGGVQIPPAGALGLE
ncbi:MAG: organic solvent tolerance protein OstA [Pirellulaceae bacterium]